MDKLTREDELALYRKTLQWIESVEITVDGLPMDAGQQLNWLREGAREALAGTDPSTGKPYVGSSGDE
jgi:hypothetical protein